MLKYSVRVLFFLILISFNVSTVIAADTYTAVASYFAEYDKVLEKITSDAQSVTSLSGTEKMFKKKIDQMPAFDYLMRTNSKGKIIAKVTTEGVQPRDFRFIGKQQWYEVISMTVKPYYGMMKKGKAFSLFWNKPIPVKGSKGVRFGGSISAKINLKKAFKDISEKEMAEFTVKLGRKILFSNLKDDGTRRASKPLSINGLPVLTIIYNEYADGRKEMAPTKSFKVADTKEAAPVKTKEAKVEDKKVAKKDEPKTTKDIKKVSKKKDKASKKEQAAKKESVKKVDKADGSKKSGSMIIPIIILLSAVVGVIVAVVIIMQSAQKKRKALLEAIDRGEI